MIDRWRFVLKPPAIASFEDNFAVADRTRKENEQHPDIHLLGAELSFQLEILTNVCEVVLDPLAKKYPENALIAWAKGYRYGFSDITLESVALYLLHKISCG
jgi:hypothetical protein